MCYNVLQCAAGVVGSTLNLNSHHNQQNKQNTTPCSLEFQNHVDLITQEYGNARKRPLLDDDTMGVQKRSAWKEQVLIRSDTRGLAEPCLPRDNHNESEVEPKYKKSRNTNEGKKQNI